MLVFGLQGSPRKKGNTNFLLTTFMQAAEKYGARTHTIDVCRKNIASPIFFYNMTAQLKAVIDRCQTFWARKYKLKLKDPGANMRRGFLLSVGATRGKNLFEGLHLTAQYFFDAIWANYDGNLTYRGI